MLDPIGLIRNVTELVRIHIRLANTEIANRPSKSGDQQNNDRSVLGGKGYSWNSINDCRKECAREDLKNRFNQLSNLPHWILREVKTLDLQVALVFAIWLRSTFSRSISSQTLTHFFYKADTTENREKLRIIFPLALERLRQAPWLLSGS